MVQGDTVIFQNSWYVHCDMEQQQQKRRSDLILQNEVYAEDSQKQNHKKTAY
jgi:hypothetical protein